MIKILVFAGSTRTGSFNKKLAKVAAAAVEEAGASVTFVDLRDFEMPLYDGDLEKEKGLPENALKLQKMFVDHHALLIASPEYNNSITGVLKNTLDWVSRPSENVGNVAAFENKVAAIISASPGALGGLRGLVTLRSMLGNMKTIVIPESLSVSKANEAFDDNGRLKDEKQNDTIKKIARRLVEVTKNMNVLPLK